MISSLKDDCDVAEPSGRTKSFFGGSSGLAVGPSGIPCNLETSTNLVVIRQQGSLKTGSSSSGLDSKL